jgi:hypothetical protein
MNERIERALHELEEYFGVVVIIGSAHDSKTNQTTSEMYSAGNQYAVEGVLCYWADKIRYAEVRDGEEDGN